MMIIIMIIIIIMIHFRHFVARQHLVVKLITTGIKRHVRGRSVKGQSPHQALDEGEYVTHESGVFNSHVKPAV